MIIVLDTETTGKMDRFKPMSHPSQPRMVQFGALLMDDKAEQVFSSVDLIIKPDGWVIPDDTAKIHGITTEIANQYGITCRLALSALVQFLKVTPRVIAHNIDFDWNILLNEFRIYQVPAVMFEKATFFCTMKVSTDICKLPKSYPGAEYKWASLQEAHKHFLGVPFEGAHSALVDCQACARIYREMLKTPGLPEFNGYVKIYGG